MRKKVRKECVSIKKQLSQVVKKALRKENFVSVIGRRQNGPPCLLYVFGPGMDNQEKKNAIHLLSRTVDMDLQVFTSFHYPENVFSDVVHTKTFTPHYLLKLIKTREESGVAIGSLAQYSNVDPKVFKNSIQYLKDVGLICINEIGYVWYKPWFKQVLEEEGLSYYNEATIRW